MSDSEKLRRYDELVSTPSLHVAELLLRQARFAYRQELHPHSFVTAG
jgi:hypothetical protein